MTLDDQLSLLVYARGKLPMFLPALVAQLNFLVERPCRKLRGHRHATRRGKRQMEDVSGRFVTLGYVHIGHVALARRCVLCGTIELRRPGGGTFYED
jgi:hypothetical protein